MKSLSQHRTTCERGELAEMVSANVLDDYAMLVEWSEKARVLINIYKKVCTCTEEDDEDCSNCWDAFRLLKELEP